MNKKLQNCFICDSQTLFYCKSIFKLQSKHTETPIYLFIEKFSGQSFDVDIEMDDDENILCQDCIIKLDDYDLAVQTAERVHVELASLLKQTQNKYNQIGINQENFEEQDNIILLEDCNTEFLIESTQEDEESGDTTKSPGLYTVLNQLQTDNEYRDDQSGDSETKIDDVKEEIEFVDGEDSLKDTVECIEEEPVTEKRVGKNKTKQQFSENRKTLVPGSKKPRAKTRGPYACDLCTEIFVDRPQLRIHLSTHDEANKLICYVCGMMYKTKSALDAHLTLHQGTSQHVCSVCGKQFTQKGALHRHMPLHTGEKPYQCDVCGKQFIHNSSFYMHKLAHNGIKDKECTVCGLQLRSTSHLTRHMRVHSGEKPYACPTCGQKFAQRYNMMSHYKVHQGITRASKVHQCTSCGLKFARKAKFDQHLSECRKTNRADVVTAVPSSEATEGESFSEEAAEPTTENYFITEFESCDTNEMKIEYID